MSPIPFTLPLTLIQRFWLKRLLCERGIQTFTSDWAELFHSLYSLLRIELLMIRFKK